MNTADGPLFTPNQITMIRFVLLFPLFALWFLIPDPFWRCWIAVAFAVIFVADNWDGVVARRYDMKSTLGAYFDPIVDHITYFGLCLMLIEAGYLSLWFLFLLITRDLMVVFLKQYAAAQNRVISASIFAKVKADLTSVPLAALYLVAVLPPPYGAVVAASMAVYLLTLPLWYDSGHEHTKAVRISVALCIPLFLLQPEGFTLGAWYEYIYVAMALLFNLGSGFAYFSDNRALFASDQSDKAVGAARDNTA